MSFETPDDFIIVDVDPKLTEHDAQEEGNFIASSCLGDLSRLTEIAMQIMSRGLNTQYNIQLAGIVALSQSNVQRALAEASLAASKSEELIKKVQLLERTVAQTNVDLRNARLMNENLKHQVKILLKKVDHYEVSNMCLQWSVTDGLS